MKYHLICFDFDGTVVKTTPAILECVQLAYQHVGQKPPPATEIEQAIKKGKPTQSMLRLLTPQADDKLIHQLFNSYAQIYLEKGTEKTRLFPHASEILKQLKQASIPVAIVSNKSSIEIKAALSHFKLIQYVDLVIGADANGLCKPDPKLYELMLRPYFPNIQRENILMVGDTLTDLKFAQAIQIDACWVKYGEGNEKDCLAAQPKYSIESLGQLTSIIFYSN